MGVNVTGRKRRVLLTPNYDALPGTDGEVDNLGRQAFVGIAQAWGVAASQQLADVQPARIACRSGRRRLSAHCNQKTRDITSF